MKVNFSIFNFPTVRVTITNETDDDNIYYNKFMNFWEEQYNKKNHFHFLFNLQTLSRPNLGLIIDFIKRQKKLKLEEEQYLDYSIILVDNIFIKTILDKIWRICPPLNTVYLVTQLYIANQLLEHLNNDFLCNEYILSYIMSNNITKIEPF
tara:strand:+ start:3382 stop:3834 length:453 start_codon:yes stop_codon:yes gene_type:complete